MDDEVDDDELVDAVVSVVVSVLDDVDDSVVAVVVAVVCPTVGAAVVAVDAVVRFVNELVVAVVDDRSMVGTVEASSISGPRRSALGDGRDAAVGFGLASLAQGPTHEQADADK